MSKKKGNRQVLKQVDTLLNTYCNGCFLHKQFVQEQGRTYAHRFCINQCTVGDSLKQMGAFLNRDTEKPPIG